MPSPRSLLLALGALGRLEGGGDRAASDAEGGPSVVQTESKPSSSNLNHSTPVLLRAALLLLPLSADCRRAGTLVDEANAVAGYFYFYCSSIRIQ